MKMGSYSYCIVIVTYNRLELLKECLVHAINQTMAARKIIVVDNCSTDGTDAFLDEEFAKNDLVDIFHSEENLGGSWGFNKGLQLAMETDVDWIILIDDDAMLDYACMDNLNPANVAVESKAFACTVIEHDKINTFHRRTLNKKIDEGEYRKPFFPANWRRFVV